MSNVVENVLQNINHNMQNKETSNQEETEDVNDLFNNLLLKQKNNNFSSPVILSQTDTVTLPELLIKHAIDNSINNNNIYTDSPINNQHFGFPSPLQHPQPQLGYEMIPTTPQIPLQHNFGSPKEILDELLYSDMFLSPHPQPRPQPETNEFQVLPIIESPHDKIENLLEQLTIHKVQSPVEQDAEKLFNINIFLEDLKTKKKNTKHKSNKSIQQNIIAIEKILKTIKTNIKKKNNKITCKNKKIKSAKKNTTKTNKSAAAAAAAAPANKKTTRKTDKIKKSSPTPNKKSKRSKVKKDETLFDSFISNFT